MKLLIAAALAGTALSASAAPQMAAPSGLGGCYARLPGGGPAPMGAGGVWTLERGTGPGAIWRFQEGPGSRGPGPGWAAVDCVTGAPEGGSMHAGRHAPPMGPLVQGPPPPVMVPSEPLRERRAIIIRPAPHGHAQPLPPMAEAPAPRHPPIVRHGPRVAPPMAHHPLPPTVEHGPHQAPPPPMAHHAPPPAFPPMTGPAPHHVMPPMAHHAPPHGFPPMAHGPMHAAPMPEPAFAAPPPFPPQPVPAAAPPRWFGDRYLTWAGKPY